VQQAKHSYTNRSRTAAMAAKYRRQSSQSSPWLAAYREETRANRFGKSRVERVDQTVTTHDLATELLRSIVEAENLQNGYELRIGTSFILLSFFGFPFRSRDFVRARRLQARLPKPLSWPAPHPAIEHSPGSVNVHTHSKAMAPSWVDPLRRHAGAVPQLLGRPDPDSWMKAAPSPPFGRITPETGRQLRNLSESGCRHARNRPALSHAPVRLMSPCITCTRQRDPDHSKTAKSS